MSFCKPALTPMDKLEAYSDIKTFKAFVLYLKSDVQNSTTELN